MFFCCIVIILCVVIGFVIFVLLLVVFGFFVYNCMGLLNCVVKDIGEVWLFSVEVLVQFSGLMSELCFGEMNYVLLYDVMCMCQQE